MKTAYELAMERLRQQQGEIQELTDEQKQRLAEITREYKAKLVEQELALKPQIEAALIQGDTDAAKKLRDQLATEITRLREQEEARKEEVRNQDGGGDKEEQDSS